MLYNLKTIHRPTDIEEAVKLLRDRGTVAMAGGTSLVGEGGPEIEAVVDLDGLSLDKIERRKDAIAIGATVRLQTIVDELRDVADGLLSEAAHRAAGWHIRNAATLGGALLTAPSSAPLLPTLAALDAQVTFYAPKQKSAPLLDFLAARHEHTQQGDLLAAVHFDLPAGARFAYAEVARTPLDDPIVCAVARRIGDEGRVWLGGVGPEVAAIAGDDTSGLPEPPPDFLGSAAYRAEMAAVLARRALAQTAQIQSG